MVTHPSDHLIESSLVRHGVGLGAAALLVLLAFFYFHGVARYVLITLAAIDALAVPRILRRIAEHSPNSPE